MPTMSFSVSKQAPGLVRPAEPTPSGHLALSFMDRLPVSRFLVDTIHVFGHGEEPAEVVRGALAKVLVHYYPIAGRFVESDRGELEVACTGDGVWFVGASANCSLRDVNYLELPLVIPKEELLPYLHSQEDERAVSFMMQVTQFTCGGFALGIRTSHAMFDGLGAAQFLLALSEMARGLDRPTVRPIWCREAISSPPKTPALGPPPTVTPLALEELTLDVSWDLIEQLKNRFIKETGKVCSKFDIIVAKVWQCRNRSINLEPDADVRLGFAANTRPLLHHVLPKEGGFYGNCAYPLTITAPGGTIKDASLFEVVSLIREAKARLPTLFSKWMEGDQTEDPFKVPLDYGFLCVSDWSRVGLTEADYGWGKPMRVAPLQDNTFIPSCLLVKPPEPKQGVRLMMRCVTKEQSEAFRDQMMTWA